KRMLIVVGTTFVVILAIVLGAYWAFVLRHDVSDEAALRKRLRPERASSLPKDMRILKPVEQLSSLANLNQLLARMGGITNPLQRDLTQAGMTMSVSTLLLSAGCLALATYVV